MTATKPFTIKRLTEVEDSAPRFGHGDAQEVRFASGDRDLETEATGVSHHRLKPGKRQPFGHRHDEAEEVYYSERCAAEARRGTRSGTSGFSISPRRLISRRH